MDWLPVVKVRTFLNELGRRDAVAQAHGGQRRDLGERPADDDGPSLEHVLHRRLVVRAVDEVVVGLVDEHRHVLRDAVEQLLDLRLRDDHPGRVVRVDDVDEPDFRGALVRDRR